MGRLVQQYKMIGMIGIPKEYGRYMYQYIYIYIIYIHMYTQFTFADTSVCFCYACHLSSHHVKESTRGGGGRRRPPPFVEAVESHLLYMVVGEVVSIAKKCRRISICALNMYVSAYVSHIPLESLSSQSSYTPAQTCYYGVDLLKTTFFKKKETVF